MDDCDEIMIPELVDVSHMSIFNHFEETLKYDKDMFKDRIIGDFSMVIIDSTTADNHVSTLVTGTNDLEYHTGTHTNFYSGQVERDFGLFGNSTDAGNITANISGSNCDHESCVEDELLSNCDHEGCVKEQLTFNGKSRESVDDETSCTCDNKEEAYDEMNFNCDTCLVEDEYVRVGGMNSLSLDFVNCDYTCQLFALKMIFVTQIYFRTLHLRI